jgi:hypothetical protein
VQVSLDPPPGLICGGDDRAREASSSARPSAFPTAVSTSSVKSASRASMSDGSSSAVAMTTMPHSRPPTLIGTPAADWTPALRAMSAAIPEAVL